MKLPDQLPPVQRGLDPTRVRQSMTSPANESQFSFFDQSGGISASGYEDCFTLQGLAQQLCLQYY